VGQPRTRRATHRRMYLSDGTLATTTTSAGFWSRTLLHEIKAAGVADRCYRRRQALMWVRSTLQLMKPTLTFGARFKFGM
jgi:hypothetical protein